MKYHVTIKYEPVYQTNIMWDWKAWIYQVNEQDSNLIKVFTSDRVFNRKADAQARANAIVNEYIEAMSEDNEERFEVEV